MVRKRSTISLLELSQPFAEQHRAAAIQVEAPIPLRQNLARRANGRLAAAGHQIVLNQLRRQAAIAQNRVA